MPGTETPPYGAVGIAEAGGPVEGGGGGGGGAPGCGIGAPWGFCGGACGLTTCGCGNVLNTGPRCCGGA